MEKTNILEVTGIIKEKRPRKRIPEGSVCEVCGAPLGGPVKLRMFNDYIVCDKHYEQLNKYGKITDPSPRKHKKVLETCCVCGGPKLATVEGKPYCRKHYMQLYNHGKLLERTIYDSNEYIEHNDYIEIKTFDKNGKYNGSTKIDKEYLEEVKKYKVYIRSQKEKKYATVSSKTESGKKYFLHRIIMGLKDIRYNLDIAVDHINGDSLDNRSNNLRICTQEDNMKNIRKKNHIVGVGWLKANKKWTARITHNYKNIHIGNYALYEEAVLARITKEKELIGEFGANKDLYYIINLPSPLEEIRKVINIPENPLARGVTELVNQQQ